MMETTVTEKKVMSKHEIWARWKADTLKKLREEKKKNEREQQNKE